VPKLPRSARTGRETSPAPDYSPKALRRVDVRACFAPVACPIDRGACRPACCKPTAATLASGTGRPPVDAAKRRRRRCRRVVGRQRGRRAPHRARPRTPRPRTPGRPRRLGAWPCSATGCLSGKSPASSEVGHASTAISDFARNEPRYARARARVLVAELGLALVCYAFRSSSSDARRAAVAVWFSTAARRTWLRGAAILGSRRERADKRDRGTDRSRRIVP